MTTVSQTASGPQPGTQQVAASVHSTSTAARMGNVAKYVLLFFLAFTWLFPLYWMFITAIKNDSQIRTVPPILFPHPMFWSNFAGGWARYNFNLAAYNSVFRFALPVRSRRHHYPAHGAAQASGGLRSSRAPSCNCDAGAASRARTSSAED